MNKAFLYPLFSLVLLHFMVALRLLTFRLRLGFSKNPSPHVISREDHASKNFKNLFEMPMLFHSAMLLAAFSQVNAPLAVTFAWVYVAARVCHSIVHCTINFVPIRFAFFQLSMISLAVIWVTLALNLL